MPRPKAAASLDVLERARAFRAERDALIADLQDRRSAALATIEEVDVALRELGGGSVAVAAPAKAPISMPRPPAESHAQKRIGEFLDEHRYWWSVLTPRYAAVVKLRAGGMMPEKIAEQLGVNRQSVNNALFRARVVLTKAREGGTKAAPPPPASDAEDDPAPAQLAEATPSTRGRKTRGYVKQTGSGAWRYSFTRRGETIWGPSRRDRADAERDLAEALGGTAPAPIAATPANDVAPTAEIIPTAATVEKPPEPQKHIPDFIPTGWDRADPDADFTDLGFTPKADPAFVHLWSPESGGTPACTLAHDAAARTTTDREDATCATCLAMPEPEAPAGADPKPPEWVLGWMSPEIRRAYQGVALEGLSCQTIAWSESVTPNVISGRVNGARQKVRRLLRWEAEREAEGKPLGEADRAPPPAYAVRPPDPLLEILNRPANNDSCSPEDPRSGPDGSDRGAHPPDQDQPDVLLSSLRPAARSLTAKINGHVRSRTISAARLSRAERRAATDLDYPVDIDRPVTRGDCDAMPRPCPFVSCSHHLYLDVNEDSGAIKLNFPHLEVWQLAETCSLDVADRGGITLEEVGAILNLTRERIRQVEVRGLEKIKDEADGEMGIGPERRGSPLAEAISE